MKILILICVISLMVIALFMKIKNDSLKEECLNHGGTAVESNGTFEKCLKRKDVTYFFTEKKLCSI